MPDAGQIVGSSLAVDAYMKQSRNLLLSIRQQLVDLGNSCRKNCLNRQESHDLMLMALQRVSDAFNNVAAAFLYIEKIKDSIDRASCGALPSELLKSDVGKRVVNVNSTDEGFAEKFASIAEMKNPIDRLSALCVLIRDLKDSIEQTDNRIFKLNERTLNGRNHHPKNCGAEECSATGLARIQKERLKVLNLRLEKSVSAFFRVRKELLGELAEPTRMLASIFPYGNEVTRKTARENDASGPLELMSILDGTFKNPRTVRKQRRKMV